jgi:nucleoside-diphosphate-sugar epimerase
MRYLVTGGSGFLGINLIRYLLERGHTVVSLDVLPFDYEDCRDRVSQDPVKRPSRRLPGSVASRE